MTSFYDVVAAEMRDLEQQRSWEDLDVSVRNAAGGVIITATNIGPIRVNVTRIWVYPDNTEYSVFTQNTVIQSGEQVVIEDEEINSYVDSLSDEIYVIKLATDRGNRFNARFPPPSPPTPGYYFPLEVQGNSTLSSEGSKYDMTLEVWNWMELEVTIDYIIVTTSFSGGGTPSEVKMLEVNPNVAFPRALPDPPYYWVESFTFSANPGADVVKVELIDDESFVIGAFYFREE
jgi:hypothetical protein